MQWRFRCCICAPLMIPGVRNALPLCVIHGGIAWSDLADVEQQFVLPREVLDGADETFCLRACCRVRSFAG